MGNSIKQDQLLISKKARHARFLQIVSVIRRYNMLSNLVRQRHPAAVRQAFEELGPTFIKIGQILSTRTDIVSPAFANELKKLQDHVRNDDFQTVKNTIETQTGQPLTEMYQSFDEQPFASASMGQTHHAVLKDGQSVVVKVQHPGIAEQVALDLSLFERALPLLKYIPDTHVLDLQDMLAEIKQSLFNELNTMVEVRNGQRFYRLNNGADIIRVPQVYADFSTQKVLVNQFMPGESIKHFLATIQAADEQQDHQYDTERHYLANVLVQNFLKQVFEDGFFHADPHPGNILLRKVQRHFQQRIPRRAWEHTSNLGKWRLNTKLSQQQPLPVDRLVYLDFGMMGEISPAMIDGIANVVIAITSENTRAVGKALLVISNQVGPLDEETLYSQLDPLLKPLYNSGLSEIDFQELIYHVVQVCRDNNIQMNPAITLLFKAFGTIEGIVEILDPNLSMMAVARPFARKYFRERFNWKSELTDSAFAALQGLKDAPKLPSRLLSALDTFDNGQARVNLILPHRQELMNRIEALVDRLIVALILAAIIVGSSLLVQSHPDNRLVTDIGITGYVTAIAVIIVFVISGIHSWYSRWRKK